MATEHPDATVKTLWHGQVQLPQEVALGTVRRRAETIAAAARRRTLVLWVSIVNNVAICAWIVWAVPHAWPYVAVFFLAVSVAQIQGLVRSAHIPAPADAGLMTSVAFLRAFLERERTFAARAWLWFLVPAGIGELSLFAGMWTTGGPGLRAGVPLAATVVAIFGFVFVRARQRARRLRFELDDLTA
jgi:hypothetical protein